MPDRPNGIQHIRVDDALQLFGLRRGRQDPHLAALLLDDDHVAAYCHHRSVTTGTIGRHDDELSAGLHKVDGEMRIVDQLEEVQMDAYLDPFGVMKRLPTGHRMSPTGAAAM